MLIDVKLLDLLKSSDICHARCRLRFASLLLKRFFGTVLCYRPVQLSITRYNCNRYCIKPPSFISSRDFCAPSLSTTNVDGCRVRFRNGRHWVSTIGLEIHAQINSQSKLFSGASTTPGSPVNSQVSLLDASIPGTLPVLNRYCVEAAVATGLALQCTLNEISFFDRKHYFYADMPTGYQITQQRCPLAVNGRLDFFLLKSSTVKETRHCSSGIKQLQLEQDSGKSIYDEQKGQSLIDLNRCGVGLMEIVFEPDLFDGEEAGALIKELSLILRCVGSCTCNMDKGALRVDANVSVRPLDQTFLGVRTEIKNLNSIRSVVKAIEYEVERQIRMAENKDGSQIINETRSFSVGAKMTQSMRKKESNMDYRFMPEPNLPPLQLEMDGTVFNERVNVATIRRNLPLLPATIRLQLVNDHGVTFEQANRLVAEENNFLIDFVLEASLNFRPIEDMILFTNLLLNNVSCLSTKTCQMLPGHLVLISNAKHRGDISHNMAVSAIKHLLTHGRSLRHIVSQDELSSLFGWSTFRDMKVINELVQRTICENSKLVKQFCIAEPGGKKEKQIFAYLIRPLGKLHGDRVDMAKVSALLKKNLILCRGNNKKMEE